MRLFPDSLAKLLHLGARACYDTHTADDTEDSQTKSLMDEKEIETVDSGLTPISSRISHLRFLAPVTLFLLSLLFGFVVIAAVQGHRPVVQNDSTSNSTVMLKPCGTSPEEARQKGCHFDIVSFCWLPTECYDPELSDAFEKAGELGWFLDPNRTQSLTREQIMTGEYTGLYVNWDYHLRHCTAMWKKLHRAVLGMGNQAIDSYIGAYEHTKHCEHMLLSDRSIPLHVINTRIAVKYPDCGI